jgi:ABC-type branched-subunit amino acid transport system substrate-binding protein
VIDLRLMRASCVAAVVAVVIAGCSHSGGSNNNTSPTSKAAAKAAPGPGDFGTLKDVCGPGDAHGATARGVTDTEIHIGTLADPSNTVIPGAGQESFDIAKAFAKWCNAAGGINGRKIIVTTRDSHLFDVGAAVIAACQSDFMLVGSANPLDTPGVKPRLACNLSQIPAYVTSAEAAQAPQQVVIDSSIPQVAAGSWRALAQKYPQAFQALAMITVNGGGLDSYALRQREALTQIGYKVVNFQEAPVIGVSNWRPYVENMRQAGARAAITLSPDISALVQSFGDVGWHPDLLPLGVQNYNAGTITLEKDGLLPPTYVTTTYWPFEDAAHNPPTQQAISLIKSGSKITPDFAHLQALNAWLLWAVAAKACGSQLTGQCVIDKAGTQQGWTGGGIIAPTDTHVGPGVLSQCFVLLKATPQGFVLAPDITKPNHDIFNCDPANVVTVKNTYTGG